nr:hypothetical protein [Janthinobacterium sp. Marseille]
MVQEIRNVSFRAKADTGKSKVLAQRRQKIVAGALSWPSSSYATPMNEPTVLKTWRTLQHTASRLLWLRHFYRAPAEVVVICRNPLQAPGVDAFLPFCSRRNRQETFLVVVLHLGPLPSHAEFAANFSKAPLHRVVQLLLIPTKLSAMNGKLPICTQVPFSWKAACLFILAQFSFKNMVIKIRERRHSFKPSNLL